MIEDLLISAAGAFGGTLGFAEAVKGPHENLGRLSKYLARQQEVADALCALEGFELTGLKKYGKVGVAYLELGEGADA